MTMIWTKILIIISVVNDYLRMVNNKIPSKAKTLIGSAIGCAMYSASVNAFVIPHKLLAGGLTGIAIIIYYLNQIPPGVTNILLNIPILIASYRWLGGWSVVIAVYGAAATSFFLDHFIYLSHLPLTQSPMVGAIVGGIFCGLGLGIVYRSGANGGGVDPLGQIARKYWGLQIASVVFVMNIAILTVSAVIFSIDKAVITLVYMYITVLVTNKVVLGFQQQKAAFIVSYKTDEISERILSDLGRGATLLYGEGAYTHESKKVVMAVVGLMQIVKLKNVVNSIDSHAFILITDAAEVTGGFIRNKNRLPKAVVAALEENSSTNSEEDSITLQKDSITLQGDDTTLQGYTNLKN